MPLVHVELDADVEATILRLSTAGDPLTHTFEAGNAAATQKTFSLGGSATGLGDVVVRSQYRVLDFAGGGVAGGLDVRLPTGDQNNLLGAGGQTKLFAIVSGGRGRFMQHANFGYTATWGSVPNVGLLATLGGATALPDEINYAAGLEFVVESRLTIVGDILGRSLRDAGRLEVVSKNFEYVTRNGGPVQTDELRRVRPAVRQPEPDARDRRREVQPDRQPAHLGQRALSRDLVRPQELASRRLSGSTTRSDLSRPR